MTTINVERRWILPIQKRGNLGKSTTVAVLAQYLEHHGVSWRGFDLDPDHRTFSRLFPSPVSLCEIADEAEAEVIKIARSSGEVAVTLIDPRAHMSDMIMRAWAMIRFPERFAEAGGRATVLVFPGDDLELLTDIDTTVTQLGQSVDYVVVRNPARQPRTRMFNGSALEEELVRLGAVFLEIPVLLALARNHLSALEAELGRGVSHVEAVKNLELPLDSMVRLIVEDWLRTCFRNLDVIARKILPGEFAAQIRQVDAGAASKASGIVRGAKINRQNL